MEHFHLAEAVGRKMKQTRSPLLACPGTGSERSPKSYSPVCAHVPTEYERLVDDGIDRDVVVDEIHADGQTADDALGRTHEETLRPVLGDCPAGGRLLPGTGNWKANPILSHSCLQNSNKRLTHARPNNGARELGRVFVNLMLRQLLGKRVSVRVIFQQSKEASERERDKTR